MSETPNKTFEETLLFQGLQNDPRFKKWDEERQNTYLDKLREDPNKMVVELIRQATMKLFEGETSSIHGLIEEAEQIIKENALDNPLYENGFQILRSEMSKVTAVRAEIMEKVFFGPNKQ